MGDLDKSAFKKLNLPDHYDPSMEKMKENMEIIDEVLNKAVPEPTAFNGSNAIQDLDSLYEPGTYIVSPESSPLYEPSYVRVQATFNEDDSNLLTVCQEVHSFFSSGKQKFRLMTFESLELKYASEWVTKWNSATDGAYSGLDADTVDGIHGEDLLPRFKPNINIYDFNDLTQYGVHHISAALNEPDTSASSSLLWVCLVLPTDANDSGNYLTQLAFRDDDPTASMYIRQKTGNSWSSWQKMLTSADDIDASTLNGYPAKDFLTKYRTGFDTIICSKAELDGMLKSSNWFGAKRVGIAGSIGGTSSWNTDDLEITVPSSVVLISSMNYSFNSFTYTSEGSRHRLWCKKIKGHSNCTIQGLEIHLDPQGKHYNGGQSAQFMTDFGVVNNCSITIGNHYHSVQVPPDTLNGRIYGLYNCSNIYHTTISDSSYSTSSSGYNNITYISGSKQLIDVHIDAWNSDYSRITLVGFRNCDSLMGCTFTLQTRKASNSSIFAGFYKCSNLTNCSVNIGSSNTYSNSLTNNVLLKECKTIQGVSFKNNSSYNLDVIVESCSNIVSYTNMSESQLNLIFRECGFPYIPTVSGGTELNPLNILSVDTMPCLFNKGWITIGNPYNNNTVTELLDASITPLILLDFANTVDEYGDAQTIGTLYLTASDYGLTGLYNFKIHSLRGTLELSSPYDSNAILEKLKKADDLHYDGFVRRLNMRDEDAPMDFDDLKEPGIYTGFFTNNMPRIEGVEGGSCWSCIVLNTYPTKGSYANSLSQIAVREGGSALYVRFKGTNWSSWAMLYDSSHVGAGSGLDADLLDGMHSVDFVQINHIDTYADFNVVPLTVGMYKVTGDAENAPVALDGTYSVMVSETDTGHMMIAINTVDSNIYRRHTTNKWSDSSSWVNIGGTGIQQATATFVENSPIMQTSTTSEYLWIERLDKPSELKAGDVLSVTLTNYTTSTAYLVIKRIDGGAGVKPEFFGSNGSHVASNTLPKCFLVKFDGTAFRMLSPIEPRVTITTVDPTPTTEGKPGDVWYTY